MREIELSKDYAIRAFDNNEIVKNYVVDKRIASDMEKIFSTHEGENEEYDEFGGIEQVSNDLLNYCIDEKNIKTFILYQKYKQGEVLNGNADGYYPIGVAIYTKIENTTSYILEYICIAKNELQQGFATTLSLTSFLDLKEESGATEICETVNMNNEASLGLQKRLSKIKGINTTTSIFDDEVCDKYEFHHDITNLNKKIDEENMSF